MFLIVLIFGIFILTGHVLPAGENIYLQNELRECCQKYRARGCPDNVGIISSIQCTENNLFNLYEMFFTGDDEFEDLQQFCSCPIWL